MEDEAVARDDAELTFHSAHIPATPIVMKTWALVENGFVVAMRRAEHYLPHTFTAEEGKPAPVVIDVSGVDCGLGFMVDAKGNVAPSEGREIPLMAHEPAYHDRSNPPAPHTIDRAAQMSTGEPRYAADDKGREVEEDKRVEHSPEEKQAIVEGSATPAAQPPYASSNSEQEQIEDKADQRGIVQPEVDKRGVDPRSSPETD